MKKDTLYIVIGLLIVILFIIKQGSGATVTIPTGMTSVVYSDGAGSGGAMIDALTDLNVASSLNIGGTGAATRGKAIAMALVFG